MIEPQIMLRAIEQSEVVQRPAAAQRARAGIDNRIAGRLKHFERGAARFRDKMSC